MKSFAERERNVRIDPQPEPSRARLQDGPQLSAPPCGFVGGGYPRQLPIESEPQPAERRIEQAAFDAQLRPGVVVRAVRPQRRLQVAPDLEPIRQAEVWLERGVRHVARRQLSGRGSLLRPAQEAIEMDL